MTPEVCIIGAGGHGKVVIATLVAAGYRPQAVFDDDDTKRGATVLGVKVIGPTSLLKRNGSVTAVLAIGDNTARQAVAGRLTGISWLTVVHPFASVHSTARLGAGTVVFAGAVIQPDAELGAHCIVNTGATVDHDCRLGEFVHVAPGARLAGGVTVGDGVLVGVGASVMPGRSIGFSAVVGAGATVVTDVAPHCTVVGAAARPLHSTGLRERN